VPLHELLRERLAGLEPRGGARRSEDRDAGRAQDVGDARRQRILGSHDDEVDALLRRERAHRVGVARPHGGEAGRDALHRGAARRDEHALGARALRDLPGERVLAAAAAEDQDAHG
jgi:hypothetical protein